MQWWRWRWTLPRYDIVTAEPSSSGKTTSNQEQQRPRRTTQFVATRSLRGAHIDSSLQTAQQTTDELLLLHNGDGDDDDHDDHQDGGVVDLVLPIIHQDLADDRIVARTMQHEEPLHEQGARVIKTGMDAQQAAVIDGRC